MKNVHISDDKEELHVLHRILRPLVRFALAQGMQFQALSDLLKTLFVEVSEDHFSLENKRLTDSRISVLTGLQRKDIKSIRIAQKDMPARSETVSPLSRLIAVWRNAAEYQDPSSKPLALPKAGNAPSFETLVDSISKDIHPRTLLDELERLEYIQIEDDQVILLVNAHIPQADTEALFHYLSSNLGDHSEAAIDNVLAAPGSAPFFERAVHYNRLTPQSLEALDALSRELQQKTLEEINKKALELQTRDKDSPGANGRFRCGAFVYLKTPSNADGKDKQ